MRVITGIARGMKLKTLEGDSVRPTSDKVKEAVFSAVNFEIERRTVLDLFAGSGQLGIEALSRGALRCVFTDTSSEAIAVIKENIAKTGFDKQSVVSRTEFRPFLQYTKDTFDIAFLDPPYYEGMMNDALTLTEKRMSDHGIIVCEHDAATEMPDTVGRFSVYRKYGYGKVVAVTIYKAKGE